MRNLFMAALLVLSGINAHAWQTVPGDWKGFSRQLSVLMKDSSLTDSVKNSRIRMMVMKYTVLLEKARSAVMPVIDTTVTRVEPVSVTQPAQRIIIYTDSLQVALLKQDIEAHAMRGANTLLYVLLFFLLAMATAACWSMVSAMQRIEQVRGAVTVLMQQRKDHVASADPVSITGSLPAGETAAPDPAPVTEPVWADAVRAVETELMGEMQDAGTSAAAAARPGSFICEVMMTAGPRKKFMSDPEADKDLGEDVCGFVMRQDTVAMWLLDGTSDLHCLRDPDSGREYFSSRLLAQHIGDALRKELAEGSDPARSLEVTMSQAIAGVRLAWIRMINSLPVQEIELLKKNIQGRNFPECASTLLAARLSIGGSLEAYRSGDSKMLLFRKGPGKLIPAEAAFTTKNPESNDRIFFRLVLDEKGELDILCNQPAKEVLREEGISDLIAFSDGIGTMSEQTLHDLYPVDAAEARRGIITDHQGTADDKSICLIRIKETL